MASKELTILDGNLLDAFAYGWTANEVEKKYGIPAARAAVRVKELLSTRNDLFSDIERKQLILHQAEKMLEEVSANLDMGNPKAVDARLKVIRTVHDLLDKQGRYSEDELNAAARAQASVLLQLIEAGYNKARELLSNEYGNVDLTRIDEAFNEGMQEANSEFAQG